MVLVIILATYQGVVSSSYQRIPLSDWVKLSTWVKLSQVKDSLSPEFEDCSSATPVLTEANHFQVQCQLEDCYFVYQDQAAATQETKIEIILQQDLHQKDLLETEILWADTQTRAILYLVPTLNTAYYIQYEPILDSDKEDKVASKLWHDISLQPTDENNIDLLVIKRSSSGDNYLLALNKSRNQLYLYGLDTVWLKQSDLGDLQLLPDQVSDTSDCIVTTKGDVRISHFVD